MTTHPNVCSGGVTTAPEVRALHDAFPGLAPGQRLPYAEIAALIGVPVGGHRWARITGRWRLQVYRERNLIVGVDPGQAFVVLDEHERLDTGARRSGHAMRALRRASAIVAGTDPAQLTAEERQRQGHLLRTHARLTAVYAEQRRLEAAAPPPPAPHVPRAQLPLPPLEAPVRTIVDGACPQTPRDV